jgi:CDP-diacylglycerol--glycerol-3-phosphate 3-phosphatidyltransferase
LTILGLLLAVGISWVLSAGYFLAGGILVLFSSAFDLLDGALARATGRTTRLGAFLDSTFDRFSEGALFLGLLAYYANLGASQEVLLIGVAIVGSVTTSYTRAKAEGLGLKCDVGVFTRPERVLVLGIGLMVNQMLIALWIVAVLSNLIAWQRVLYVWQQTRGEQS